jgi:hypothetical protein
VTALSHRKRPIVVDAHEPARHFREVFTKKAVTDERHLPFSWPSEMQLVGDSLAVAYSSDKWRKDGEWVLYKHLAESRNRVYAKKDFFYEYSRQSERAKIIGPVKSFGGVPMPKQIAFLGLFSEAHFVFFTGGTARHPTFSRGSTDDGVKRVFVPYGLLGGGVIRWSKIDAREKDQPFLVIYTERNEARRDHGGVHMIIVGDELDIEADGIVG